MDTKSTSEPGRVTPDKFQREKRRADVARLYLQGLNQVEIAAKLGVAQSTVSEDLKRIRKGWKDSQRDDVKTLQAMALEKIRLIARAAWEEWENTKGKEGRGKVRYLTTLIACVEKECKLLGLYEQRPDVPGPGELDISYEMAMQLIQAEDERDGEKNYDDLYDPDNF